MRTWLNRSRVLALLPVLALGVWPALASAETSATKKDLVQKLIQLQQPGIEQIAKLMVEQPALRMLQSAGPILQQMPEADRASMAKALEGDARKFVDETLPGVRDRAVKLAPTTLAPVLEERLSEDELKTVIAWLESPVSKKYGQLSPELQKTMGDKLLADTRASVEPKLKALEAGMAKRLGLSAQGGGASKPAKK